MAPVVSIVVNINGAVTLIYISVFINDDDISTKSTVPISKNKKNIIE